jgi:hypothetical protein
MGRFGLVLRLRYLGGGLAIRIVQQCALRAVSEGQWIARHFSRFSVAPKTLPTAPPINSAGTA